MLLRQRANRYRTSLPGPEDVLLLIEVADSSLLFDRDFKLPLYAAAGIPEVWIVDLDARRVLVFRLPEGGSCREVATFEKGGSAPVAFPDVILGLDSFLG